MKIHSFLALAALTGVLSTTSPAFAKVIQWHNSSAKQTLGALSRLELSISACSYQVVPQAWAMPVNVFR